MKVMVTGGTGFIGGRLVRRLAEEGLPVIAPARAGSTAKLPAHPLVEAAETDLLDASRAAEVMRGVSTVFHLASIRGAGWGAVDEEVRAVNVAMTAALLRAAVSSGVKRFIYVSSVSVYGHPVGGPIDEGRPTAPVTRYGRTKLEAEKLVGEARTRDALLSTIIRPVITYGPGDGYGMVTKLMRLIDSGAYLTVGAGGNRVHLIYIDDLVEGLMRAMLDPTSAGGTYILAGKEPITVNRLAGVLSSLLGRNVPPVHVPLPVARACAMALEASWRALSLRREPFLTLDKLDIMCRDRFFDAGRAGLLLGFNPVISYEEGLARTVSWFKEAGIDKDAGGGQP